MPDLRTTLSDAIESYFRELEKDGYRPEGCCADDLADRLLGLPGVAVVDAEVYRVARKGLVDLTEAWAELRMDTPEDQSLHDRLVALSRVAADLLPAALSVEGNTKP